MPHGYRPADGYGLNPLLAIPRNLPCPCESGRKFKACCLPRLPRYVPNAMVAEYRKAMWNPELVRFTEPKEPEHLEIPRA